MSRVLKKSDMVRSLRSAGVSWAEIAHTLNISEETARALVEPKNYVNGEFSVDALLDGGKPCVRIYSPCGHSYKMPSCEAKGYAALIVRAAEDAEAEVLP